MSLYTFQLTKNFKTRGECWRECKSVIKQIEEYEGRKKGYRVRKTPKGWAVFTTGILAEQWEPDDHKGDIPSGELSLPQYRNIIRRVL